MTIRGMGKKIESIGIPILLVVFFKNIEEEERYLLKEFNNDYICYKKHVSRLIPKLI